LTTEDKKRLGAVKNDAGKQILKRSLQTQEKTMASKTAPVNTKNDARNIGDNGQNTISPPSGVIRSPFLHSRRSLHPFLP
jgi:hypothetical protein